MSCQLLPKKQLALKGIYRSLAMHFSNKKVKNGVFSQPDVPLLQEVWG